MNVEEHSPLPRHLKYFKLKSEINLLKSILESKNITRETKVITNRAIQELVNQYVKENE